MFYHPAKPWLSVLPRETPKVFITNRYNYSHCRTVLKSKDCKQFQNPSRTDYKINYGIFIQCSATPTIIIIQRKYNCSIYSYISLKMWCWVIKQVAKTQFLSLYFKNQILCIVYIHHYRIINRARKWHTETSTQWLSPGKEGRTLGTSKVF